MKGKRIILTVTNDLTYDRRMHRICNSLSESGAEVLLVGRRLNDSIPYSSPGFRGVRLKCFFNKGPLFYIEFNKRLFLYLLFSRFDVVCACDLDTALAVRWASSLKRSKTVYDAHEFFTEVPEISSRPLIKKVWEWIGLMTIPGFDLCYTVGEQLAARMGKKYNVDFKVIRNIAPRQISMTGIIPVENRKKILLYLGALNVGRGLEACIVAMRNLPDWEFWLAGKGDLDDHLKALAVEQGVGQRVSFLGWVLPKNLPILMNQARLGINLLEKDSLSYYYSLPNKFFDFMHAGLPAINMNYPEYVRINQKYPCSILVDVVSPEKIIDTIQFLDLHPDELIKMAKACEEASNEYTWENESKKLVMLYEDLLSH